MKPVMIVKKRSLTTLFIMCSMTRFSWCTPHQIRVKGQLSCMAASSQMTMPAMQPVILRAPWEAKLIRWIVQLRQSTVKNLSTISNITLPIWQLNIRSTHPWRLTMVLCSSMKTRKCKLKYDVLWWIAKSSVIEKPEKRRRTSVICCKLITQTTQMNLLTFLWEQACKQGLPMTS